MSRFSKIISTLYLGLFLLDPNPTTAQSFNSDDFTSATTQSPSLPQQEENMSNTPATEPPAENIMYNQIYNKDEIDKNKLEESVILLYYTDFKIDRTPSGRVMCDMRLSLLSTVPNKITNLSLKLIWPEIQTVGAFYDVEPNKPIYYAITLMGEGCYSMDKAPNLVLNRCRIKGLSSEECAKKLTWAIVR